MGFHHPSLLHVEKYPPEANLMMFLVSDRSRASSTTDRTGRLLSSMLLGGEQAVAVAVDAKEWVMKNWLFVVVGAVLFLVGLVWTLQGLDVVKGSFMSGAKLWLAIGLLIGIGGLFLINSGVRRLRTSTR
ncbi:MAG TPA: hypothetical protein VHX38_04050 [Pseudonocardiaceae bacterium]|nr:hypothetical protein [Pseudonocardiaceae bacterium]